VRKFGRFKNLVTGLMFKQELRRKAGKGTVLVLSTKTEMYPQNAPRSAGILSLSIGHDEHDYLM